MQQRLSEIPAIRQTVKDIAVSTATAARVLFPERFTEPFSVDHHRAFNILDDDHEQLVAIAAPRSWGKSSVIQLATPAKRILCRQSKFIVPVSCTDMQAKEKSENLKRKLTQKGSRVEQFFGSMKTSNFSKDMWIANNPFVENGKTICSGTCVLPRSFGQQVRGFLHEDFRPDLLLPDDMEDKESVMSEDQRSKRTAYLYEDLLNSVSRSNKDWRCIFVGTVLHEDSLLVNLLDNPNWTTLRLELCDDDLNSKWPERYSNEDVLAIFNEFRSMGLIDAFYREYRNIPQSPEDAPLAGPYNYYDPDELKQHASNIEYVVVVDPAKSSNTNSADTAIICCGLNRKLNRIYVVDMIADRLHPEQQIEQAVAMATRWGARVLGVEVTGINEYATWPWENYIITNRCNLIFEPLAARKGPSQYIPKNSTDHGKDARISAALVPVLRQGLLFFNRDHTLTTRLHNQMSSFPRAKKKDIIDALAHVIGLYYKGERYMSGKEVASGQISDDAWLEEKKEMAALDKLLKECREENYAYSRVPSYLPKMNGVNSCANFN